MENIEFEKIFNELTSLEGIIYYYHVTDCNPDYILDEGLFLSNNDLLSTTIEIPIEFKNNPVDYCLNERGNFYRKNPYIILLGILNGSKAVERNFNMPRMWDNDEFPKFVIPSRYIIGYIDTNNLEIVVNENYQFLNEYVY